MDFQRSKNWEIYLADSIQDSKRIHVISKDNDTDLEFNFGNIFTDFGLLTDDGIFVKRTFFDYS